ncbi:hypothetical protein I302_104996 [Kwoniella bestiolae CBS 10118]|uniref:Mitochondrial chaperone BCS1 n=1 Tax=Kwoniella bestiolae CBS 10118 TaxID=1296100 RepID=A0A1B9FR59_9TREE|nr:hypothetical protein I302_08932 [Kwoniella bestiolae CBS 10118]OCF21260.1 hypothetical protein I302_08932 [Kwoniella bestiolae CBS 10118]
MSAYLHALSYSDDLLALPQRLLYTLSKGHNVETFLPMAVRAIVFGMAFAVARKAFRYVSARLTQILFPTAYISYADPSYNWITSWIAQDSYAQSQIHDFQLSTIDSKSLKKRNKSALVSTSSGPNTSENGGAARVGIHNSSWAKREVIGQVMPTYVHPIRIRHNGNYLWVTRRINGFAGARSLEHFRIQTIAFRPHVLREFLIAARDSFFAKEERELLIFHAKRINPSWQNPVSRPARPWSSVILPGNMKEKLLKDVERFLSDKETRWYASRGIPHRRGYLLHGSPGSGKTTLVTAIASKLDLNIYVINPAQRGMDDAKLAKLFRDCPSKSVILIEDIDCIFPKGRHNHIQSSEVDDEGDDPVEEESYEPDVEPQTAMVGGGGGGGGGKHDLAPSTVTMSGLLNAIDGVSSQEGCVLVATTNHPNRLDPALSRAGRFDVKLEFKHAIPQQARELYLHFYPLEDFQVQIQEKPSENIGKDGTISEIKEKPSSSPEGLDEEYKSVFVKDQDELEGMADQFVRNIFDRPSMDIDGTDKSEAEMKVSMASLQSYLLQYKEDPISACNQENVKMWLDDEAMLKERENGKSRWGLQGQGQIEKGDEDLKEFTSTDARSKLKSKSRKTKKARSTKVHDVPEEKMKMESQVENSNGDGHIEKGINEDEILDVNIDGLRGEEKKGKVNDEEAARK